MTNIQIIIDENNTLKAFTCTGISMVESPMELNENSFGSIKSPYKRFDFSCNEVIIDESPRLVSLPDELLLRIRDYNIDIEHQKRVEETNKLEEKIEFLKNQVAGWELRRNTIQEQVEVYEQVLLEIYDDHPGLASEVAARLGLLDLSIYLAKQAREKEEKENDGNV